MWLLWFQKRLLKAEISVVQFTHQIFNFQSIFVLANLLRHAKSSQHAFKFLFCCEMREITNTTESWDVATFFSKTFESRNFCNPICTTNIFKGTCLDLSASRESGGEEQHFCAALQTGFYNNSRFVSPLLPQSRSFAPIYCMLPLRTKTRCYPKNNAPLHISMISWLQIVQW